LAWSGTLVRGAFAAEMSKEHLTQQQQQQQQQNRSATASFNFFSTSRR